MNRPKPQPGTRAAIRRLLLGCVAALLLTTVWRIAGETRREKLATLAALPTLAVVDTPRALPPVVEAAVAPSPSPDPVWEEPGGSPAVIEPDPAPAALPEPVIPPKPDAPASPSFNGRPLRKARTLRMLVTAYSPDARSCGPDARGITASGYSVWTNGMKLVAADTRLLPFGTVVSIPGYNDGEPVPVLDRGGAIKGHRLDVLYPTHERALQWGVQRVDVTIWEYAD